MVLLWGYITVVVPQDDQTPLHQAAIMGRGNVVKLLVEKGANVNVVNKVSYFVI